VARRYGRALRGERCRASVPHGHVWTYWTPPDCNRADQIDGHNC
jgi:hypothetical protein